MQETISNLDAASIPWDMEANRIFVAMEDELEVMEALPLVTLEPHGSRLQVRYDLPLLVEEPKVEVNHKAYKAAKV